MHDPTHPTIRSEREAAAWLEGLINVEKRPDFPYRRFDLAPIRRLLACLGDPHLDLEVLHIAGSKGKGSTALLAESILCAADVSVGVFTSPHLERWTERFRIDGREVDGARLAAAVERVRPHVEALRDEDPATAPTFFDATTAAAFCLFRDAGVSRTILEVGLGGRLDSTNVVTPRVACVTNIELEHTDRLGSTLAAIAGEKAGILKVGSPAVAGRLPEEARAVVAGRAVALGVSLEWLGEDFDAEVVGRGPKGLRVLFADGPLSLEATIPLLGDHQADNAALALACLLRAGPLSASRLADAACRGLAGVRLPGRIEILRRDPTVLIDAAHTATSARALSAVLESIPRRRTRLVLSISADKDVDAILAALLPCADEVRVTRAEATRSLDPAAVAALVRRAAPDLAVDVVPNPHLALRSAATGLEQSDLLCVAGSVYLAGIARSVLSEGNRVERVQVSRREPPDVGV
jgi:dihydrofolate synthase/folylpolyglutamate synthase